MYKSEMRECYTQINTIFSPGIIPILLYKMQIQHSELQAACFSSLQLLELLVCEPSFF